MDIQALRTALAGRRFGQTLEHHGTIGSTNDRASLAARAGADEGLVVLAETQTRGRGRFGRRWEDAPGKSLLFSLVLRPRFELASWPLIGLAAAVAGARAIRALTDIPARIKWPNDILIASDPPAAPWPAKVGGALLEADDGFAVLGMGVNVLGLPDSARRRPGLSATSLADHCPDPPQPAQLLVAVLNQLEELYGFIEDGRASDVIRPCQQLDITVGMAVTLSAQRRTIAGIVHGIDALGALVLHTSQGPRRFVAGEVSLAMTTTGTKGGGC